MSYRKSVSPHWQTSSKRNSDKPPDRKRILPPIEPQDSPILALLLNYDEGRTPSVTVTWIDLPSRRIDSLTVSPALRLNNMLLRE